MLRPYDKIGPYTLVRQLGQGAFGVVWLAERRGALLTTQFALKLPLDDQIELEKIKQEAQTWLQASGHPNVLPVIEADIYDGQMVIVSEYIPSGTLQDLLERKSGETISQEKEVALTIGILAGLEHLHGRDLIHRDLKPANVLMQGETPLLTDFGLARILKGAKRTSTVGGTLAYMAPETFSGDYSAQSDIWSVGVILFEALTGALPYPQSSLNELILAIISHEPQTLPDTIPRPLQSIVFRALNRDLSQRFATAAEMRGALSAILHPSLNPSDVSIELERSTPGSRVAILYRRKTEPDTTLLNMLEAKLTANGYAVFIDRHLVVGVEWAREIEKQIRHADAVIPLLSSTSISSEMMAHEVEIASAAASEKGKPRLLPVRINYDGPLDGELAAILNPLQHTVWTGPQDDERLVEELILALQSADTRKQNVSMEDLEAVGGAVSLDSRFWIVRSTESEFRTALKRQDSIVLIKGARQMGKTSLLARGLKQAKETGAACIRTDFQKLNSADLESVDSFYLALAEIIADQLDLDFDTEKSWSARRSANVNFERFLRREVLNVLDKPLVWAMDEVDRLFTCKFGSEVFGLFRSWHNERSLDPEGPWARITLVIAYATEAHLFITDMNQSPFNVGTRLALEDFSLDQVNDLNGRYGSPLRNVGEVKNYHKLLGGQPYLTQRGLNEMVTHAQDFTSFESLADRDEGIFGDHLRRFLVLLASDSEMCDAVRAVLRGQPCPSAESFYRLRSGGILAGDSIQSAQTRCDLYTRYLRRHLI